MVIGLGTGSRCLYWSSFGGQGRDDRDAPVGCGFTLLCWFSCCIYWCECPARVGKRTGLQANGGALDQLAGFAAKLAQKTPVEIAILEVEVVLGVFIGAVTFTGSVIAFGKLAGMVDGKPSQLPGGHKLNAAAGIASLVLAIGYCNGAGVSYLVYIALIAGFIGWHLIRGIGGADMPVVVSMLNSYSG